MAATSDSNDASDIFWPGYVDAISNLAINLLFVIAVMAIVVISATLQINDLLKRKDRALGNDVSYTAMETKDTLMGSGKSSAKSSTSAESQQQQPYATGNSDKVTTAPNAGEGPKKSSGGQSEQRSPVTDPKAGMATAASPAQQKTQQETQTKVLQQQLETVQQQLRSTQAQLNEAKAALGKAQSASGSASQKIDGVSGSETESGRVEVVASSNASTQAPAGSNAALVVNGGVVVPFDANAIELNPALVPAVLEKMASFAPVKSSKWRITVIVPKGFSEAKRLGFYRANALRNALLQNGVSGDNIDVKTLESNQPSADNTRVIIRPAP